MRYITSITVLCSCCVYLVGCQPAARRPTPNQHQATPESTIERVVLRSKPSGAIAKLSTGESCKTPCSVKKTVEDSFSVTFSKEGYSSSTVRVTTNLEALRQYNSRRGMRVDHLNVPTLSYVPNPVSATLEPAWSK